MGKLRFDRSVTRSILAQLCRILLFAIFVTGCQNTSTSDNANQKTLSANGESIPTENFYRPSTTPTFTGEMGETPTSAPIENLYFGDLQPDQYLLVRIQDDYGNTFLDILSMSGTIVRSLPIQVDAYWNTSNDGSQIFILPFTSQFVNYFNASTHKWANLNVNAKCIDASSSSEKELIAFACEIGIKSDIYIYDLATSEMSRITNCLELKTDTRCEAPSWSNDGQYIAYVQTEIRSGLPSSTNGVYFFNTDCVKLNTCMNNRSGPIQSDVKPAWSNVDELIVADSEEIRFYDVKNNIASPTKVINLDATNLQGVSDSPDGQFIAYAYNPSSTRSIVKLLSLSTNAVDELINSYDATIIGWFIVPK